MDTTELMIGVMAGALGMGYFVYGKKQGMFMPMVCGAALWVHPYLVSGLLLTCLVGIVLLTLPFFVRV